MWLDRGDYVAGYWWQCDANPRHIGNNFEEIAGAPLVRFLFGLAERDWPQADLVRPCRASGCGGSMRIHYDFPAKTSQGLRLVVVHIVGRLRDEGTYLPMLWESVIDGRGESGFDFKYVGRDKKGYQAYGLARPAFLGLSDLKALFKLYHRVVGKELLTV
jgi:hypothetical protein